MASGSIRKRGNAWEVRIYVGRDPVTGRERHLSRSVKGGRRAAERLRNQLLAELDQGAHQGPDATLATLLERWCEARSPDWSPKNQAETRRFVNRIAGDIGSIPLRDLTAEKLDTYYGRLRAGGLTGSSVHRYHDVIHAALNQAVRWRWLDRNPADTATPGAKNPTRDTAPTDEELDRLLAAAAADPRFLTYLVLAADAGPRRGELVALRWSDFDLEQSTVRVTRAISDGVERDRTKGGDRRPAISLTPGTVDLLRAHRARAAEAALACGVPLPANAFVFSHEPDGSRPWRADYVNKRFGRLRAQLGLDHVRPHDLRHYVATTLLAAGVDVGTVADRLGHTMASTTLNIYRAHVPAADQRAAAILAERRKARPS